MEVSGDKKSRLICLDTNPLFFYIVPKFVQALVIMYDEIFQALMLEEDSLLPKPFLDLGFDSVIRRKSASYKFFQFSKHLKVQGG
jgi:hypothetical protein